MAETIYEDDAVEDIVPTEQMSDRKLLEAIYDFIRSIKKDYDVATDDIELTTKAMEYVLGVTRRSIVRWRSEGIIRYHTDERGNVFHLYSEIFPDVKSGRIKGRGFCRDAALRRLRLYRLGVIKGGMELDYECLYGK